MLSLNQNKKLSADIESEYYLKLLREGGGSDRAWQLSLVISAIVASCEGKVNSEQHILKAYESIKSLNNFTDAGIGNRGFRPGIGMKEF